MKRRVKYSIILLVALLVAAGLTLSVSNGTIPRSADPTSVSYAKLCNYQPTSGRVWTWAIGSGSGIAFYRLHNDQDPLAHYKAEILTDANAPNYSIAPWWWAPKPNGRITVYKSGGLGFNTDHYAIYDPDKKILFIACEWD